MKMFRLLFTFLFVLLIGAPLSAQFSVGVFGVSNQADLSGTAPSRLKFQSQRALGAGLFTEFSLTDDLKLTFQPMVVPKGSTLGYNVPNENETRDSIRVDLDYFSIPVMVRVVSGNHKTYVTGGFEVGFLRSATAETAGVSGEEDLKPKLASVDILANLGFGAMIPIGKPLLMLELRYSQGLVNISDFTPEGDASGLPPQFKNTGMQFFVGFILPVGKSN